MSQPQDAKIVHAFDSTNPIQDSLVSPTETKPGESVATESRDSRDNINGNQLENNHETEATTSSSTFQNCDDLICHDLGFPFNWVNWCQTSQQVLGDAETAILKNVKAPYTIRYVNVGPILDGKTDILVWTWSANNSQGGVPIVLIHGLGSGLALWSKNFDFLSNSGFPVYAIDLPGFGRSSRPVFSDDPEEAERQFINILDAWRDKLQLEKMILIGHSFGGFLSFSYSLTHPNRVSHLICVDPWGFNKKPGDLSDITHIPIHHRAVVRTLNYLQLNPLGVVRFCGPFGPRVIGKIRADLIANFSDFIQDASQVIPNYVFHINAQNPTGECAFRTMMAEFGWAKNPMHLRIDLLDPTVPLTLIYGSKSWVDHYPAEEVARRRHPAFVDYHTLEAGHHVYAAQPDLFHDIVINAAKQSCGIFSHSPDGGLNADIPKHEK